MNAIAHLMDWTGFRANRAAATGVFPIPGAERNALYFDPSFCPRRQKRAIATTNQIMMAPARIASFKASTVAG